MTSSFSQFVSFSSSPLSLVLLFFVLFVVLATSHDDNIKISANKNGARNTDKKPSTGPAYTNDPRTHDDPTLTARTAKSGNIAPRYKRAMLSAIDAERRLYACRFANGTYQRILDLDCFFQAINQFPFNATWYKQAAITAKVGGFVQRSFALWNSSLITVLDAKGFLPSTGGKVSDKDLPPEVFTPIFMLEMVQRTAPVDAVELAKVWVEVLVAEGKLDTAAEIVDSFLLPPNWQDLAEDVGATPREVVGDDPILDKMHNLNNNMNSGYASRFENRSWAGHVDPIEAGEIYRSLLSPADAAAAQSFMNENAETVKKRTLRSRRRKERAEALAKKKNKKKDDEIEGIYADRSKIAKPLDNSETAGHSFTALLSEHMAMTAELLIRDTLQSTSQIKASVRRNARAEFEKTQRRKCGRAFHARSGGIVRWMTAVKFIEDCVLRWPYLAQWMRRDDESDMIVKEFPGFHAIARAETHQFAALGVPKLMTLLLNLTGPAGGAIEDAMKQTPLHLAAGTGHKETVAIIMGFGVSPTVEDIGRVQALYHICRHPHLKKMMSKGFFQLPPKAPAPDKVCLSKEVRKMLEETAKEPRKEERALDDIDDSGAGWTRTIKRREGTVQKCDSRIEWRSVNSINENDFAARYASGSEPVLMRSERGLKSLQTFFAKKNLLEREGPVQEMNGNQQQQKVNDPELAKMARDIIKVRVEIVPEAEKYGSGLALNKTIGQFILNDLKQQQQQNEETDKKNINKKPPMFATVDITEEHPWAEYIWGVTAHEKARDKKRASLRRYIKQDVAEKLIKAEEENLDKVESRVVAALGKKFARKKKQLSSLSKKEKEIVENGEFFRPPFAPRNRHVQKSVKQSFFTPVPTASLHFASTGATSNLATSFIGRIHGVVHGEQRLILIPPAFAVTSRDPVSLNDFEEKTTKFRDITEHQEDWHDKVIHSCVLLPGDLMFIPPFWSYAFESYNGESVSVMGRITWR